jgi:hypothetical protein
MIGWVLDDEVDGDEAERSALAFPAMDEYSSMLFLRFLDKTYDCVDDILVDNILNIGLCPVKSEKAHAFDGGVVMGMFSCAIDYMCDLIEGEPFDILLEGIKTCAITSSPMKMLSVIFMGIESY